MRQAGKKTDVQRDIRYIRCKSMGYYYVCTRHLVCVGKRSGRREGPRPRHIHCLRVDISLCERSSLFMPSVLSNGLSRVSVCVCVSVRRETEEKRVYMRESKRLVPCIRDVWADRKSRAFNSLQ